MPLVSLNLTREQLREVVHAVRVHRDAVLFGGEVSADRELANSLSQILDTLENLLENTD
jgi:hypothetical protein